ncbi:MAG: Rossmann-like and DUF2520 domain-containing protein [Acidobacteriota bacterium]
MSTISIVGAGRLGGALALALDKAGFDIDLLIYRTSELPAHFSSQFRRPPVITDSGDVGEIRSDIIFITTQDAEIAAATKQLAGFITGSPTVFITSGAISSSYIGELRAKGCRIGSLHPLVSISDPLMGSDRFSGAYFCVEGDPEAIQQAEPIIKGLGGHSFSIDPDKKALYHASAVMASGDLLALIDMAVGILEKCGLEGNKASAVLLPLIKSTVENFAERGIEGSLTGPFVRGDSATFERHLNALKRNSTNTELETYLNLGERSLEIAMRTSANSPNLVELAEKVSMAKKDLR